MWLSLYTNSMESQSGSKGVYYVCIKYVKQRVNKVYLDTKHMWRGTLKELTVPRCL